MRVSRSSIAGAAVLLLAAVSCTTADNCDDSDYLQNKFDYFQCYKIDPSERMPNTLDNLIGILAKFENETTSYINMDEMAEMIINRYRTDGIVFHKSTDQYSVGDLDKETEKQELIFDLTSPSIMFPSTSCFETREECGLHMLVSHSTDLYPVSGIDAIWDGTINRNTRGDRNKRSPQSFSSSSSSSSYSSGSSSFSSGSSNGGVDYRIGSESSPETRSQLGYSDIAVHPVENGVMETQFGPVAGGTLLTGIMAMEDQSRYTLNTVVDDVDYMPSEMRSKTLKPVYASSLSGDMGQMALTAMVQTTLSTRMGPTGRYHNCTTCARQYSLDTNYYTLLSRAELFAGLDVMIINKAYLDGSGSYTNSLTLAQLMKLYYSDKGLPNYPDFKACNRMKLYKTLDTDEIYDQALNFMYAYQDHFTSLKDKVEINKHNFAGIESEFKKYLDATKNIMESFINSYSYEDEGYAQCGSSSLDSIFNGNNNNNVPSETEVDLIMVYAKQGSTEQNRDQRQMIGDVARRLRMASETSAVGVLQGTTGAWLLEYSNVTNIGDWACNFTSEEPDGSGGSSSRNDGIDLVLGQLTVHYNKIYDNARQHEETSSGRSQVVIWQVPGTVSGDEDTNNKTLQEFRSNFPDVRIIFVGKNQQPYQYLLDHEDDFLSVTGSSINQVVEASVIMAYESPRYFIYPACDPNNPNITNIDNYRESSHVFQGAITPNYTTYIKVPAQNFRFSEDVTFKISGKVRTCASRTNRYASEVNSVENINNEYMIRSDDDSLICAGGPDDENSESLMYKWPCDRYISTCNPIYLSVTALDSSRSNSDCKGSTSTCEFPHQIKYELTHEHMTCGASTTLPALMVLPLVAAALLQRLLQ